MHLLVVVTVFVGVTLAAPADETGRYYHDDSGKYVHDPNDGRYIHDGTGNYRHDGTGGYVGQKDTFGADSKYRGFGQGGNLIGAGTFQNVQKVVTPVVRSPKPNPVKNFGNVASGTSQYPVQAGADGKWRIIKQSGDVDLDGYHWDYLTENGINAEESGKLINKGTDRESMEAKGFYTYTGPDNVVYTVHYTADENGFVAQGEHLPTPPPLPDAIVRALDFQRSIGKL